MSDSKTNLIHHLYFQYIFLNISVSSCSCWRFSSCAACSTALLEALGAVTEWRIISVIVFRHSKNLK